jgi:hypothetical protein
MTRVEDRLRSDLRAMAQQAQPELLRPLRVPPAPAGWRARFRSAAGAIAGSRKQRWLAAAAAVAAVAVIVTAVNIAGRALPPHKPASPAAAMPRYYAANTGHGRQVVIRDSATGRQLSAVAAPAGHAFSWLAAAADDRRFVLADVGGSGRHAVTSFQLLRLTAAGGVASLSPLRYTVAAGPAGYAVTGLAVNRDASMLAIAITPIPFRGTSPSGPSRITEVAVAAGAVVRSWTAPGKVQPGELSWVRDQEISFMIQDHRPLPHRPAVVGLRLLDTARADGDLLSASSVVRLEDPGRHLSSALVTPDGSKVIAWTYANHPDPTAGGALLEENSLGEFSVRTGKLIRVLYGEPTGSTLISMIGPFSADPSGSHLLIEASNLYGTIIFGRLDKGRFTSLPHPSASTTIVIAAW